MAKKVKSPFHLKKLVLLFDAEQKLPEKGRMNKKTEYMYIYTSLCIKYVKQKINTLRIAREVLL